MIAWLAEAPEPPPPAHAPREEHATVMTATTPSGRRVREEALQFGDGERLFGILTEPTDRAPRSDLPTLLFLNVGANHRVGPNRMYVSLARDLATRGYLGFRFDVAGLGDSRIAPGARENRLYSKDSVVDVKAAMDFLERTRDRRRFVLLGLCSGAYLAFHTAVEDPRVVGQVLPLGFFLFAVALAGAGLGAEAKKAAPAKKDAKAETAKKDAKGESAKQERHPESPPVSVVYRRQRAS